MRKHNNNASEQIKKIDSLFSTNTRSGIGDIKVLGIHSDKNCDLHHSRRNSLEPSIFLENNNKLLNRNTRILSTNNGNYLINSDRRSSIISNSDKDSQIRRRQSFSEGSGYSTFDKNRKRNSWNASMFRNIEHPSAFPSLLRSSASTYGHNNNLNNNNNNNNDINSIDIKNLSNLSRRSSLNSLNTLRPKSNSLSKKPNFGSSIYLRADSSGNTNLVRRDSFGSRNLNNILTSKSPRDYVSQNNSSILRKNFAAENLKNDKNIFSNDQFNSINNNNHNNNNNHHNLRHKDNNRHVTIIEDEDFLNYNKLRKDSNGSNDEYSKLRRMSMDSLDLRRSSIDRMEKDFLDLNLNSNSKSENGRPHFVPVTTLEDVQAVRCAEFHPSGRVYAVGSNSKTFRICEYPSLSEIREEHTTYQPTVLFKRTKHHKGSIYCMGWAPDGELVATGSNDKTIKLMRYDDIKKQLEGREIELTMHDGTIRDLCFLEDSTNKASLLISGGAGDCKIYVTDCGTATPFQALSGHGSHILSLYNWGGAMFVSGSQDKTIRFWDLRTRGCVNTITPATTPGSRQGSPVASVCVDPSGRLLVSGHEDSSCVLYDIRGNRPIQCFKPHASDIRSIRFSPSAYYLLTAGYDNKLVLTDLQGDLTLPLPSVVVAHHTDKVISGRWHPADFSFLSTSADKTATLWALPPL